MTRTDELELIAVLLWDLLDDIDTIDDVCREDDAAFRHFARKHPRLRFTALTLAEYEVLRAKHKDVFG